MSGRGISPKRMTAIQFRFWKHFFCCNLFDIFLYLFLYRLLNDERTLTFFPCFVAVYSTARTTLLHWNIESPNEFLPSFLLANIPITTISISINSVIIVSFWCFSWCDHYLYRPHLTQHMQILFAAWENGLDVKILTQTYIVDIFCHTYGVWDKILTNHVGDRVPDRSKVNARKLEWMNEWMNRTEQAIEQMGLAIGRD